MSPWPQKFIMCITGMDRSVCSIAQLNAFIITQLRKDFLEEGSLEQPRANWSNLHACHGQKSCSLIFCIAHYDLWLRKVPAYYSPVTLSRNSHLRGTRSICLYICTDGNARWLSLPPSLPSSRPLPPPPPTVSGYVLVRLLQLAHGLPRPVAVDGHLGERNSKIKSSS